MNARYYDPGLGRFISPDTIIPKRFDPQSLNRYAYCRNNPILYTDPSGHSFGLTRTINHIGHQLRIINQDMYREYHRFQGHNPNINISGEAGVNIPYGGENDPNSGGRDGDNNGGTTGGGSGGNQFDPLTSDEAGPSANTYSLTSAGYLADAGFGDFHSKAEEWALNVAEWSEASGYVANGVAIGSLLFGPEAAPVYGGASVAAMGLDALAGVGYLTHSVLSHEQGSLYKGISSFTSIFLDSVPMFKPGVSLTRVGGAISYMEQIGSRSGYIAQWYGTLRIGASDVTKVGLQESMGYFLDRYSEKKKK